MLTLIKERLSRHRPYDNSAKPHDRSAFLSFVISFKPVLTECPKLASLNVTVSGHHGIRKVVIRPNSSRDNGPCRVQVLKHLLNAICGASLRIRCTPADNADTLGVMLAMWRAMHTW